MKIDKTTSGLICVRITANEAKNLVSHIEQLLVTHQAALLPADCGQAIVLRVIESGIVVDSTIAAGVRVDMGPAELEDLKDAIGEFLESNEKWPLDHALEPLGATFLPASIRDLVFESAPSESLG